MKKIRIIFPLVIFLFSAFALRAQKEEGRLDISYNAAFPTGSFKDMISSHSYRGFNASLLFGISDKIQVGAATGFQDFYQKYPRQLYKLSDGSDLSAVVTYSIQTIPILAKLKYNFTPAAVVQPYAAIGVGGNLIEYNGLFGEFGNRQGKFRFAARPEAGLHIPFKKGGAGFSLGASYNIIPFNENGFKNLNSVGVQAGLSIPLRK